MGCGKSKHDVAPGNTVLRRKKSSVKHNKDQEIGAQTKDDNNSNVNVNVNVNSGAEVQKHGDNVVKEVVGGKADDVDSNGVNSKTENARVPEETALQKSNDIVAGKNANAGEEKVSEKSEEVFSGGGQVESSNSENANKGEDEVVEKSEEVVIVADEVESKTDKTDVQEEVKEEEKKNKEGDGEEGLVPQEASEKSQGEEEEALKLKENDQKVNNAAVAEEQKTGDGKDDVSVKEEIMAKEEANKDIINVPASEGEDKELKAEEKQKENPESKDDVKAN